VKTSASVAPAQIGRLKSRQNFLVQSLQVLWVARVRLYLSEGEKLFRGRIVEFVLKQVHLQKVVGAGIEDQ